MLKTLAELTHEEDMMLLEIVALGEVDEKQINGNVLFATKFGDYFLGLMTLGNQVDPENECTVICLGESRIDRANMMKIGSIQLVNGAGEITETIKKTRDNYL